MRKLLILTAIGMLLGGLAGCRFMECLYSVVRLANNRQRRRPSSPAPTLARHTPRVIRVPAGQWRHPARKLTLRRPRADWKEGRS